MKKTMIAVMSLGLLITACKKDEASCEVVPFNLTSGALISNEGNFPDNGSISHVDLITGKVTNSIYVDANCEISPGVGIQSVGFNSAQ